MTNQKTKRITLTALFIAIEIAVACVPFLGYIPLGFINATTLHIPVIIAAILLGQNEGMLIGLVFGLTSIVKSTVSPSATSFIFSPFITIGGISGGLPSVFIAIVPRVLIGLCTAKIYQFFKQRNQVNRGILVASVAGSMVNTILVMSCVYIFYADAYATAIGIVTNAIVAYILAVVFTNGVVEAIVAGILSLAVCKIGIKMIHLS